MCTNFSLFSSSAKSPYSISARTMDFAVNLNSQLQIIPQGQSLPQNIPPKNPLTWKNKYGYVAMQSSLAGYQGIPDGMNEAGLSIGALWLAGSEYPSSESATNPVLYNVHFPEWVLGNFDSVESVKSALNSVTVISISELEPQAKIVTHFIISDASGANLIVEFTKGEMQVYDSDNGVMTNAPSYPYHLDNLSNYVNLSLKNNPQQYWGQEVNGSGCLGMPGDHTAPSRFVRMTMLQQSTQNYTPTSEEEAIGLANRILQNVTTPIGSVVSGYKDLLDYTQWGVVRDQKNLVYYFFTHFNNNLFAIDLKKIDWVKSSLKSIPILRSNWVADLTSEVI